MTDTADPTAESGAREPDALRRAPTVAIPMETARLVDAVFLPSNPNKLRKATPEVVAAAHEFKRLVALATPPEPIGENDANR